MEEKRYNCIDVFKFIASILVIAIHIDPFVNKDLNFWIRDYIGRVAVPYFFIISGFLLYSKSKKENFYSEIIPKYLKKIIIMYIIWTLLYFPLIMKKYNFEFKNIIYIFRDILFSGSYGTLWYFNATIVAVFLISKLTRKYKINNILFFSAILYVIALLGNAYFKFFECVLDVKWISVIYEYYKNIFLTTRNGIFEGIFLVALGVKLASTKTEILNKKMIIILLIALIVFFIETFMIQKYNLAISYEVSIGMSIVAYILAHISIKYKLKYKIDYDKLRKMSTLILLMHLWINVFVGLLVDGIYIGEISLRFLLTVFFSILSSYLIVKLSEKYTFLRKLYS